MSIIIHIVLCTLFLLSKGIAEVFGYLKERFAFLSKAESDLPIFTICQVAHGGFIVSAFQYERRGHSEVHYAGIVAEATHERAKVYHFIVVP